MVEILDKPERKIIPKEYPADDWIKIHGDIGFNKCYDLLDAYYKDYIEKTYESNKI